MKEIFKSRFFVQSTLIFVGLPVLIWALGDQPERTLLKEALSVFTILAFCQVLGLLFLSRSNKTAVEEVKMRRVVGLHKFVGYSSVAVLLFHPLFLVVPRFFESGVAPMDALVTILTTFTSLGVLLGLIAWGLMLILGIMSLMRDRLPLKYTTWRMCHGILSIAFMTTAAWHAIDLGRHSGPAMSTFITVLTASGVLLLLRTYTGKKTQHAGAI